jgi:hypothetical protein
MSFLKSHKKGDMPEKAHHAHSTQMIVGIGLLSHNTLHSIKY